VAALTKQDSGEDTKLEVGSRGEFSVWAGGRKVAEKSYRGFPSDAELLAAVRAALAER
jgi:hypothetical protein